MKRWKVYLFLVMLPLAAPTLTLAQSPPPSGVLLDFERMPPRDQCIRFVIPADLDALPQAARVKIRVRPHPTQPGTWVLIWGRNPGARAVIRPGDYVRLVGRDSIRVEPRVRFESRWRPKP